jgi:nitrite reductase/ring-hydroxylating ferredoxin subunit
MANYVEVANLEQLPPGKGTVVTIEGKDIALFNVDGTVYAMDDGCLHHGVSLGTSELDGKIVTCRGHGWKYDVTTGSTLNVPGYGVAAYPVKVVDGKIMVAADETLNPTA